MPVLRHHLDYQIKRRIRAAQVTFGPAFVVRAFATSLAKPAAMQGDAFRWRLSELRRRVEYWVRAERTARARSSLSGSNGYDGASGRL